MFFPPKDVVNKIKDQYPEGTRVKLVTLNDLYCRIPEGTLGTVDTVDDIGTIHVNWDGFGMLGVVYGEDECVKVHYTKE